MAYRVSAVAGIGTAISVIVKTADQALAKVNEYQEDGFAEIVVRDMEGGLVDLGELSKPAN